MDESEAVEAFEHLGLTSYEAKVFIALQRIGSGTARDVSRATDVPRSQVYSAAESLADRGLVNVQQSNPMQYRPVSLDAAQSTLRDRLIEEQERAFEYVEAVRKETEEEQREDIWTIRGRESVADRVAELVEDADERIVFGTRFPEFLTDEIAAALTRRAQEGLDVTIVTENENLQERFRGTEVTVLGPPPAFAGNERHGRFMFADEDILMLSVANAEDEEMAVWSSHTSFATVLIRIIEESLGVH